MERKFFFIPVIVAMAGTGFIHSVSARSTKIGTANAHFTSTDPSGCISTDVFVYARNGAFEASIQASETSIKISQVNDCTGAWLMGASGSAPSTGLQIAPNLASASLDTTMKVFDQVSQQHFDVNVNLTWISSGKANHTRNDFYFASPGAIVKEGKQLDGVYRQAQASGSISNGSAEFTPQPSVDAEISSAAPIVP